jgi:hypothetical protein
MVSERAGLARLVGRVDSSGRFTGTVVGSQ